LRRPPVAGVKLNETPKTVFSNESLRESGDRGHWFEIRVEDLHNGYMSKMGIGFTATDPETLMGEPLPAHARGIPLTYVVGYAASGYWNGERFDTRDLFKDVKPFDVFTLGVLCTPRGSLEIYVNRTLVKVIDPVAKGFKPIDVSQPLWAVVDCSTGVGKATLLPGSSPPDPQDPPEETDDEEEEDDH